MIDFHCQIATPGSEVPTGDGVSFQPNKGAPAGGEWVNLVWQETIEMLAETLRTPLMVQGYRQVLPVVYAELSRRLIATSADRVMAEMAKHQVRQAVVAALDPIMPTREVVDACVKTKGILIPFGSVDPWTPDWREQLEHNLTLPVAGLNFHFSLQHLPIGSRRMGEILDIVALRRPNLPVYLHAGDFPVYEPAEDDWATSLSALADRFPCLTFVCGHCGWNRPAAALKAARKHENLLLETSWQPPLVLNRLCRVLGPHRLLLGSDYPLASMRRAIHNSRAALSRTDFAIVSRSNARALIARAMTSEAPATQ
ncbi:MAG: amidohydrolase family protein [Capsulimonadaceae bacterium]|nr:amidohydrolase family protein [Capsulimonadaceae bacterium]